MRRSKNTAPCAALLCLLMLVFILEAPHAQAQLPSVTADQTLDLGDLVDPFDPLVIIPSPYVYFGTSVAIDGNYAIVTGLKPGADGRAYLYSKGPFGWTREGRLDEAAGVSNLEGFGAAVSMGGGTAAILQRGSVGPTTAVHLFSSDSGYGAEETIDANDWPVANVASVSVYGNTLAMGDEKAADTRTGVSSGRVAVFTRSSGRWSLQAHLAPSDPMVAGRFGTSVALEGDRLLVGAPGVKVDNAARRGACYVFERREGVWKQTAKLVDVRGEAYQDFGTDVALSGNTALATAPGQTYSNIKGTVAGFQRQASGAWKFDGLLPVPLKDVNPAAPAPQFFGSRLALSGSIAAVGSATGIGSTERSYLYQRRGDRWQQLSPLDAPRDYSSPGAAVAVSGKRFFAGAAMETTEGGIRSGRVRTYSITSGLAVFDGPSVSTSEMTTNGGGEIQVGDIVVGRKVSRSITVQNLGAESLEGLSFTGNGVDGEELVLPAVSELPVGAAATFTLNITPSSSGQWKTRIAVEGFSDSFVRMLIDVSANVLQAPEPPTILTASQAQLAVDGAAVDLLVDAGGTEKLNFQWYKEGKALTGETSRRVRLLSASESNAGFYKVKVSNASGAATSADIPLAVYQGKADTSVRVNDGAAFSLKAPVTGPGVRYRWLFNNAPLTDSSVFSGSATAELRVSAAATSLAGQYAVVLNPGAAQIMPQRWNVSVLLKPQITNAEGFIGQLSVAKAVTSRIIATPQATRYYFKGLPPGVVGDLYYGTISGKPAVPGAYAVKVIASNAAGNGLERQFNVVVAGLDARAVGPFGGVLARNDVNLRLGGSIQGTVSAVGKCTGVLMLGARRVSFTTSLFQSLDGKTYFADVDASQASASERYELRFDIATGRLSGNLVTETDTTPMISGWSSPWSSLNPSTRWSNYCTATMTPVNLVSDFDLIPGGTSFTTLRIDTIGTVLWIGRMADGSVTTLNTVMSPGLLNLDGSDAVEMPVFIPLSGNTASVLGSVRLNQGDPFRSGYHRLTGALDWFKPAAPSSSKSRSYKRGITRHDLRVSGAGYTAAMPGVPVLGLPLTSLNAKVSASGAGLESAVQASLLSQPFTLTGSAKALIPLPNLLKQTLTFDRTRGTFTGSFVLTDADLLRPSVKVMRTVTIHGVLLASGTGEGFFSLPAMPDVFVAPPTTVNTSPIRSGRLGLKASNAP